MKKRIKNKFINKLVILVMAAALVLSIIALIYLLIYINKQSLAQRKKEKDLESMIAPYYISSNLKVPKDVLEEASKSAVASISAEYKIPILMYHYVEYIADKGDTIRQKLDIVPATFEGELKALLEAGYKTYFVRDIPNILNKQVMMAPKGIVLSFDDGYEDFYQVVYPMLQKYQMKATIYIIVDYIGRKDFLTNKEIAEMAKSGLVEIGSHTLDHVYLKSVYPSVAEKQIAESKKILEDRFGIKVESFAYPNGAFNQETLNLVKNAGYTNAVSVIPGDTQSQANLFYLYRIRPGFFTGKTIIGFLEGYKK